MDTKQIDKAESAPHAHGKSLEDVHSSVETKYPNLWKRMFAFAGPAYLVSVGYMDPGNWATDLEGGSRFGYALIWVILMSNIDGGALADIVGTTRDCDRERSCPGLPVRIFKSGLICALDLV